MNRKTTISFLKGLRSIFYSQGRLEQKGYSLEAGEQRRWENTADLLLARAFALGFGLSGFGFLFKACDPHANPFWHGSGNALIGAGLTMFIAAIIYLIAKKN